MRFNLKVYSADIFFSQKFPFIFFFDNFELIKLLCNFRKTSGQIKNLLAITEHRSASLRPLHSSRLRCYRFQVCYCFIWLSY